VTDDLEPTGAASASFQPDDNGAGSDSDGDSANGDGTPRPNRNRNRNRRRRGGPGGANRAVADDASGIEVVATPDDIGGSIDDRLPDEMPDRPIEGTVQDPQRAAEALVPRKPKIGDTRPSATPPVDAAAVPVASKARSGRNPVPAKPRPVASAVGGESDGDGATGEGGGRNKRRRGSRSGRSSAPGVVDAVVRGVPVAMDDDLRAARRGRERNGQAVGRYHMCVHVSDTFTQIAVLEGRNLIEHYVSRPTDDVNQIHGNIYLGRVTNVLPGMEAAFVEIGTPKNAVLYRADLSSHSEDLIERPKEARIESILRPRQSVLVQVTKNPIGLKGARLTEEVSLPGRFAVLVPNQPAFGISKRLEDGERKRLRSLLERVMPPKHGVIVRTAAEGATAEELEADLLRLISQWDQIEANAARAQAPKLLYREPSAAVRVIREEFTREYRQVQIDSRDLYDDAKAYLETMHPELADRVHYYDAAAKGLALFEAEHVHEQVHKALDRKVWLPSGGSLVIDHTEALTVIDVNTGKNVGSSSLEETVFRNNLEAAHEIARQLRLRDIGGIIVIDFIDMEIAENRKAVVTAFRDSLARDKTRTQVFDISDLGLVEMTRKRVGEGLLTAFTEPCEICAGRGMIVDFGRIE
jgi:ribonuclease E